MDERTERARKLARTGLIAALTGVAFACGSQLTRPMDDWSVSTPLLIVSLGVVLVALLFDIWKSDT